MTFRNLTVLMILPIVDEVRFCNRRNMHCILGISTVSIPWRGDVNSAKLSLRLVAMTADSSGAIL